MVSREPARVHDAQQAGPDQRAGRAVLGEILRNRGNDLYLESRGAVEIAQFARPVAIGDDAPLPTNLSGPGQRNSPELAAAGVAGPAARPPAPR